MKSIDFFKEITQVPRPSGHEEKIAAFLMEKAKGFGWDTEKDSIGNVIVRVPGAGSGKDKEILVLQGHMDMVCEKEDGTDFDFMTQGLNLYEEDGFLKARGTTLGADNGAGLALSYFCGTLPDHPPLEIVITVDEERGLFGASGMKPGFFKGKRLINMDSHEEGEFTVGCAGGGQSDFSIKMEKDSQWPTDFALKYEVSGLLGGHSGADIHEKRASANILMAHQLKYWQDEGYNFRISAISGGSAHNAIARNAAVVVCFDSEAALDAAKDHLLNESDLYPVEQYTVACTKTASELATTEEVTNKLIKLLNTLKHGPLAWSSVYEGYVETSANLANLKMTGDDVLNICYSYRSFIDEKIVEMQKEMLSVAKVCGFDIKNDSPYPAWPPAKENPLLDTLMAVYKEETGKEGHAAPVHAGLECGYMERLCPGMKAVSMGPVIFDLHAPTERLDIASMDRMEKLLAKLMQRL